MSAFYDEMQGVAVEMIDEFGYLTQLERDGAITGPPHNPQQGPSTRHDCNVVEVDYSLTNRDATLVLKGDKLGLISTAIDVAPTLSDRILLGGVLYRFIDLQPLSPGGQILLYEFHARR
ncbi:hypothetical protein AE929_09765 [Xanthomonas arboricola]|uniref:Uncharacterized protein n=1 Tax=Xanthomonas campestris pv. juglandis TaxID=195709 RepID=A0A8E4ETA0_XANCJ|nr:hypothetical protein [Xanthomonas arboricola]KOA98579.1 hypothetical protein AE920_14815 [Xanthomonas arboricola]KOB16829.1 hypothetical protein AE924_06670 [Xanthomonas arboricola]KOB25255.1 hypothetical protein AE927_16230 [Xanthomonas arboricola]KOB35720.1 hypothetical protein AE929_09765 [Xanthomonas arboricola]KOB45413.1 hypothetical protein AE931_05460 [Xanthomonas arboricola]